MTNAKEKPASGGNRAQADIEVQATETYRSDRAAAIDRARAALLEARSEPGFDEKAFLASEVPVFASLFRILPDDVRALVRQTRKRDDSRFVWRAAITRAAATGQISLKGVLVADGLFQHFNDASAYCWPSQQTLAAEIGWKGVRGVQMGLDQLEELGAIAKVRVVDLPPDVKAKVMGAKSAGGSGRDPRGIAYRRVPPDAWQMGDRRTDRTPRYANSSFALNPKAQPKSLREDSFSSFIGDSSETLSPSPAVVEYTNAGKLALQHGGRA